MDALVALFAWPVVTLAAYLRFLLGACFCVVPLASHGTKDFIRLYKALCGFPFGKHVFSGLVSFFAPYSSSVNPCVERLDENGCEISVRDWWWLRNPYSCLHAIALANIGEQAGGILMLSLLQRVKVRAIPVRVDTVYHVKARGVITGICEGVSLENVKEKKELPVVTKMYDKKQTLVAQTTVYWMVEPRNEDKEKKKE